jgi:hypothetical protein
MAGDLSGHYTISITGSSNDSNLVLGSASGTVTETGNVDVSELNTSVAGVKTDVAAVKTDVAGVNTAVVGVKTAVDSNTAHLEELMTKLTELNAFEKNKITIESLKELGYVKLNIPFYFLPAGMLQMKDPSGNLVSQYTNLQTKVKSLQVEDPSGVKTYIDLSNLDKLVEDRDLTPIGYVGKLMRAFAVMIFGDDNKRIKFVLNSNSSMRFENLWNNDSHASFHYVTDTFTRRTNLSWSNDSLDVKRTGTFKFSCNYWNTTTTSLFGTRRYLDADNMTLADLSAIGLDFSTNGIDISGLDLNTVKLSETNKTSLQISLKGLDFSGTGVDFSGTVADFSGLTLFKDQVDELIRAKKALYPSETKYYIASVFPCTAAGVIQTMKTEWNVEFQSKHGMTIEHINYNDGDENKPGHLTLPKSDKGNPLIGPENTVSIVGVKIDAYVSDTWYIQYSANKDPLNLVYIGGTINNELYNYPLTIRSDWLNVADYIGVMFNSSIDNHELVNAWELTMSTLVDLTKNKFTADASGIARYEASTTGQKLKLQRPGPNLGGNVDVGLYYLNNFGDIQTLVNDANNTGLTTVEITQTGSTAL